MAREAVAQEIRINHLLVQLTKEEARLRAGMTPTQICRDLGIHRGTFAALSEDRRRVVA